MNAIDLIDVKQWMENKDPEKYKEAIEHIEQSLKSWLDNLSQEYDYEDER